VAHPTATDRDLATAAQLQRMLLPPSPFVSNGWKAVHRFEPAAIAYREHKIERTPDYVGRSHSRWPTATTRGESLTSGSSLKLIETAI
jgi:hypothetical protein